MINTIRQKYNADFSAEKYQVFLNDFENQFPNQLDFRVAETPLFVPKTLKTKLVTACEDIIDVLVAPDFKTKTDKAIPAEQFVPNEDAHTRFLAIDFAICKDTKGKLCPQLIELQGFPSLFAYQAILGKSYQKHFYSSQGFDQYFNDLDEAGYIEVMRNFLVGDLKPENVILLEIYPEKQKTRIDFSLTKHYWGIESVCITKIKKRGKSLFYEKAGKEIAIKRIYNRLIFDDLQNFPNLQSEFKLTDDVDVEWFGHPNWFFRISKYTLPFLESPFVPKSYFLSDLAEYPHDLENYVLKPLFSFAGSGVQLHIKAEDLDKIQDKTNYLLQQKVVYSPVIQSPNGLVKCEIRMLYIWETGASRPRLLTNLARLSRGEMIGVRFNKDFDWVGGSVAFMEQ